MAHLKRGTGHKIPQLVCSSMPLLLGASTQKAQYMQSQPLSSLWPVSTDAQAIVLCQYPSNGLQQCASITCTPAQPKLKAEPQICLWPSAVSIQAQAMVFLKSSAPPLHVPWHNYTHTLQMPIGTCNGIAQFVAVGMQPASQTSGHARRGCAWGPQWQRRQKRHCQKSCRNRRRQ